MWSLAVCVQTSATHLNLTQRETSSH